MFLRDAFDVPIYSIFLKYVWRCFTSRKLYFLLGFSTFFRMGVVCYLLYEHETNIKLRSGGGKIIVYEKISFVKLKTI